jgi:3',5'-cyclic AMP phosphodiesterase CpdA
MRILSVSDMHCGNLAGLTPDKFNTDSEVDHAMHKYRRKLYNWTMQEIEKLKPIDVVVCNGDAIDGKGFKSGGNDQLTVDTPRQIDMATEFLKSIEAKQYLFTVGTGYHTGAEDDWEKCVAATFGTKVEDVAVRSVNGLIMKWRHHIGTSQNFSGRATPLMKQQEWDILWSVEDEFVRADVLVFSHAHYFQCVATRFGMAFIQPGLQGLGGSQLGSRRLGGIIDYGFMHFDVESKEDWTWELHRLVQTPSIRGESVAEL